MFVKKHLRRDSAEKYDIVILDAFNGDYIPFHMMTKEFLEEVQGVLADDGVVIANVFSSNLLFDAEMKTFLAVFGQCQVFVAWRSTNAMLVSPGKAGRILTTKDAVKHAKEVQSDRKLAFNLVKIARRLRRDIEPDTRAEVLTDDRAPVNWLRMQEKERE
jgi:spermidine synthase